MLQEHCGDCGDCSSVLTLERFGRTSRGLLCECLLACIADRHIVGQDSSRQDSSKNSGISLASMHDGMCNMRHDECACSCVR